MDFENIQVALRFRPFNEKEKQQNQDEMVWDIGNRYIAINKKYEKIFEKIKNGVNQTKNNYIFDECFDQQDETIKLYVNFVKRIILSTLNGYNGTIFCYGQSNSGKTSTFLGNEPEFNFQSKQNEDQKKKKCDYSFSSGLIFNSIQDIYEAVQQDFKKTYVIKCSYFEIKNDQIFDLLDNNIDRKPLQIHENTQQDEFVIKDLIETQVKSFDDIQQIILQGKKNKKLTLAQNYCSKTHTIIRFIIKGYQNARIEMHRNENQDENNLQLKNFDQLISEDHNDYTFIQQSQLSFVDLSGTEKHNEEKVEKPEPVVQQVSFKKRQTQMLQKSDLSNFMSLNEDSKSNKKVGFARKSIILTENKQQSSILNKNKTLKKNEKLNQSVRFDTSHNNYSSNHQINDNDSIVSVNEFIIPSLDDEKQRTYSHKANEEDSQIKKKVVIESEHENLKKIQSENDFIKKLQQENEAKEGKMINKSLFYLKEVIIKRSENNSHIPVRNSTITKILKTALCGNSRTLFILCAIGNACSYEETVKTLKFGLKARLIENQVNLKMKDINKCKIKGQQ